MMTPSIPNEGSPLRRSLIVNRTSSASIIARKDGDQNDDEAERAALLAEDRNKSSSQFSTPKSVVSTTNSISSPQKEHFQGCLKLYAENKINKDNAWNLQLIDFMSAMLRKHDSRMENLQMASTTLDASTRIYSFRVDAVHHDVLKMAGGLSKAAQVRRGKKPDGEEEDENNAGENDAEGEGGTQRKKEKRKKASKGSLSTNAEHQLNGEVEINECIDPFFAQLAATTGDMTSSNRAFNATLPIDDKSLGLILRSDVLFLDNNNGSTGKQLDPEQLEHFEMKKSSFPIIKDSDQICAPFHGFSISNWNPEDEEANMKTDKWIENNLNLSQQAMAFDLNADVEPLPNDDMTNHFHYDGDDGLGPVESDEEEMGVMKHALKTDKPRVVAQLVDMRPSSHADAFLEYSYCSAVIGSWAGPSHWKLKNNINRMSRLAERSHKTITNAVVKKAPSRKKKQLDFLGDGMTFNRMCNACPEYSTIVPAKIMIGRKTLSQGNTWNEKNFKTPIDRGFNLMHFRKFYLKQSVVLRTVREEESQNAKEIGHRLSDINDYDYNNDNDISYCPNSQPNNDEGGVWLGEEGNEGLLSGDIHNQNPIPENNGDMVEPPAKVAKIFIPYAMRAKKVDMKQLKQVSWRMLTYREEGADKENDPNGCELERIRETNFTNFYKKLPLKLSTNMKEALSVSLSLLAVLHLANEKGLMLKKNSDCTDFFISREEKT